MGPPTWTVVQIAKLSEPITTSTPWRKSDSATASNPPTTVYSTTTAPIATVATTQDRSKNGSIAFAPAVIWKPTYTVSKTTRAIEETNSTDLLPNRFPRWTGSVSSPTTVLDRLSRPATP